MNKIEKMIKELCPNGVEWKKLGEVCEFVVGGDIPKNKISKQETRAKIIHNLVEYCKVKEFNISYNELYEKMSLLVQEADDKQLIK